jgi:hypothetical protein
MSGNANITLFLTIALLLVVVSLNCLLIPKLGAIGAAFSTLSGFLMINSLMVYFILKLDNFVTLNIGIFISIVLLTVNAICLTFLKFNILVPILLLSGTTIILAFSEWKIFFSALKYLIIKFQFQLYN